MNAAGTVPAPRAPVVLSGTGRGHDDLATRLYACLHALDQRDRDFAMSMLDGQSRYHRFTDRQLPHVTKLIQRGEAALDGLPDPTRPVAPARPTLGDFAPMVAVFDRAAEHLRAPKLRLQNDAGRTLTLSLTGAASREPGTINVLDQEGGAWFGRIRRDGTFQASHRDVPSESTMRALRAFAAAPEQTARQFGRDTGRCCCCGRTLSDPASIAAGIGPVCATRFGL